MHPEARGAPDFSTVKERGGNLVHTCRKILLGILEEGWGKKKKKRSKCYPSRRPVMETLGRGIVLLLILINLYFSGATKPMEHSYP